ncbi:unnamed protein product [Euphydryas editha]|uniref:G-protein coupled receptors family 1 profile domain-containing protein n=1 Tax=Euphydryas editha TaxID=104508 RepID=A0AAU9TWB0_EUPED|nr:unnamed protein product [Euphydryas editha]
MSNNTTVLINDISKTVKIEDVATTFWLIGIGVSFVGLLAQLMLFVLVPNSRKFDEVILCQMTIARTLYTVCEYDIMFYVKYYDYIVKNSVFVLYFHSDVVLLCLMFIFSKNLYNKVVVVFPLQSYNLMVTTVAVWTVPLLLSLLFPFLIKINDEYFEIFYNVYAHIKFFICILNALVFVEIIRVAFSRNASNSTRNVRDFLKTSLIAFVLVSVTSLQLLITDIISYYYKQIRSQLLVLIFCVVNSYQVVALTGILFVLVRSKMNDSIVRLISIKLDDLMASFA